jgi:hypothetical protein
MIEKPNRLYKENKNIVYSTRRHNLNDTMMENESSFRTVRKNPAPRKEIFYRLKSNNSYDEYFFQGDEMTNTNTHYDNCDSRLGDTNFYFYSFDDNQDQRNTNRNNSQAGNNFEDIKEFFLNP